MTTYYLYHISTYNDIGQLNKGYIGITNNPEDRFYGHKSATNRHIKKATEDGETLIYQVITYGPKAAIQAMEAYLRPERNMAWNTAKGGQDTKQLKQETRIEFEHVKDKDGKPITSTQSNGWFHKREMHYGKADIGKPFVSFYTVRQKCFHKVSKNWVLHTDKGSGKWFLLVTKNSIKSENY